MRMLIAIAVGCALVLGITNATSSAAPQAQAVEQLSSPMADDADEPALDSGTDYICQSSPRCQRASQCVAYCAGGVPVCVNGCCACAS